MLWSLCGKKLVTNLDKFTLSTLVLHSVVVSALKDVKYWVVKRPPQIGRAHV